MKPLERLRKAVGYLDHLEFGLTDKLSKVRNVQTLIKNSIKDIMLMEKRLEAYDTIIQKDLKKLKKNRVE